MEDIELRIYACDDCGLTVFDGETECAMCGSTEWTELDKPWLERLAMHLLKRGHRPKEVYSFIAKLMLEQIVKEANTEIVRNVIEKEFRREGLWPEKAEGKTE